MNVRSILWNVMAYLNKLNSLLGEKKALVASPHYRQKDRQIDK